MARNSEGVVLIVTVDAGQAQQARFTELVAASWKRHNAWEASARADDVALGATITSFVNAGWQLIDLESDGTSHMVRFQIAGGSDRLLLRLQALCEDPVRAQALGRLIRVEIAYGLRTSNFGSIKQAVKDEWKSGRVQQAAEPGVITVDGEVASGYVYASVPLILNLDDYFDGFKPTADVTADLNAAAHSVHRYLSGRLAG